jgi:uncharacterized metal-binding protein YceD (DUF177 family)
MSWSKTVKLGELPVALTLQADEAVRKSLAKELGVAEVQSLSAELRVVPWMDGAELSGRWRAKVTLTCGVSLDPFEETYDEPLLIRMVPQTSPLAIPPEEEVEMDPEAEDPPDVLEGDSIDVAAYLAEQLALAVPPFPRKPGAVFEPPPPEEPPSPFAVLLNLKPKGKDEPPQGEGSQ